LTSILRIGVEIINSKWAVKILDGVGRLVMMNPLSICIKGHTIQSCLTNKSVRTRSIMKLQIVSLVASFAFITQILATPAPTCTQALSCELRSPNYQIVNSAKEYTSSKGGGFIVCVPSLRIQLTLIRESPTSRPPRANPVRTSFPPSNNPKSNLLYFIFYRSCWVPLLRGT